MYLCEWIISNKEHYHYCLLIKYGFSFTSIFKIIKKYFCLHCPDLCCILVTN
uniref:Uncharacterized protein n=1 Tax=Anguilla anguilla TaxID=7936 RepID=A0A0E9VVW8_ANGAN